MSKANAEIKYDPELPFAFISTANREVARFADREIAARFGEEVMVGRVVDTTPKPKIPEDADYLIWEFNGETGMAYRDGGEWYGAGEWWTAEEMAENLKFAEVTVLVRKEET